MKAIHHQAPSGSSPVANPSAVNPLPSVKEFSDAFHSLENEVGRVVVGHPEAIRQILIAFFAGGHVLIEGAPGVGKTLIVRCLSEALGLSFSRIQFTIDLMPADITGTRILQEGDDGRRSMVFAPGPLFAHLVLADEINRATPKTQSALLEAMAELQVTVAGATHILPTPFFVLATLNPIEMEGTYPLPEAQLDRFLLKVVLAYPGVEGLREIVRRTTGGKPPSIEPVFEPGAGEDRINALRRLVREVIVAPEIEERVARLVHGTIPSLSSEELVRSYVSFGVSPRAAQALILGAKVVALLDGRVNVARADVDAVAVSALAHRLVLNFAAQTEGIDGGRIVERLLETTRTGAR